MIIETLITNLGVSVSQFTLIITLFVSFLFMAKDLRLGLIFLFIFTGAELIAFYYLSMNIMLHTIVLLASLVMLTLSLLFSRQRSGGIV